VEYSLHLMIISTGNTQNQQIALEPSVQDATEAHFLIDGFANLAYFCTFLLYLF
jgi:hypothetical protein